MAVSIAPIIDQAKLVSDNRRNLAIADTDWVIFVNWAIESWYKFRISLDPGLYFQSIDFALVGGATGSTFNLDLAFTVRLIARSLPAFTTSLGPGPGRALIGVANGALSADSTAVVAGDRILYAPFVSNASSGIFVVSQPGDGVSPFILVRTTDFDQTLPTEVQVGAMVTATAGALLANDPFILTSFAGIVDTSAMGWTQSNTAGRFRALHGLDVNPDTGARRTVASRTFRQRNETVGWWTPAPVCDIRKYDLRGNMLVVTPYESSAGAYRAYYRAAPYKFATPTDTDPLDAVLEPEIEAIALLAACSALNIEETSNDPYIKRINVIKAEVTSTYERDDGEPGRIADVEDLGWYF